MKDFFELDAEHNALVQKVKRLGHRIGTEHELTEDVSESQSKIVTPTASKITSSEAIQSTNTFFKYADQRELDAEINSLNKA